ncbi:plasmid maintenance protein (plasmid) [Borrelia puertoricensis]|uniref:plasmid maintenance protein n=1 Tax=Borrelia puertoricensis TaxID=2756107 RepID=UPI003EBCEE05
MKDTKKNTNKHQHKLIVLISTLSYMNLKFKKYTQSDILYYFNNNMKKNDQKPIKLKTLQNYLYKLAKVLRVTINYHRHLGINMGTEIHYKLKYPKKECYRITNKHFRDKKEERHQKRVNAYLEKTCIKNSSVEKEECLYNNIYNKEKKNKEFIERLKVKKYAKKCCFKSNTFLSILNLNLEKNTKIEILKTLKRTENFFQNSIRKSINNTETISSKLESKRLKLNRILDETKISLEREGYNSKQLKTQIQNVYNKYKYKPHFIIENNKYNDLKTIIGKLKDSTKLITKETEKDIKNNIFSILLEQLRSKVDTSVLVPILKNYLNKQNKLEYNKVFSNYYYYKLLELIEGNKNYLKLVKSGENYN